MAMAMGMARVFGCSVASASGRVLGAARVATPDMTSSMSANRESVFAISKRFASKKAGGSTKNGRDSESKRLGVKKFGGCVLVSLCSWLHVCVCVCV